MCVHIKQKNTTKRGICLCPILILVTSGIIATILGNKEREHVAALHDGDFV
jgi:hypothetical protein